MNIVSFLFFIFASLLIFGLVLMAGGILIVFWFQKKHEYFMKTMEYQVSNCYGLTANVIRKKPDKDG